MFTSLGRNNIEFLGSGARSTVQYDVPAEGAKGTVPKHWEPVPFGKAVLRRQGDDVIIVSVGVGVHRAMEASQILETEGILTAVLDLRIILPLDKTMLCETVAQTGHLLVVDEDYENFGLSGELSAVVLEAGIFCKYGRVCTQTTIPYARHLEDRVLLDIERICANVRQNAMI